MCPPISDVPSSYDPDGSAMNNFCLTLESYGRKHFDLAFQIAFGAHRMAWYYWKSADAFTFYWHARGGALPLPVGMDAAAAADLAWRWLTMEAAYPEEPDHDGSNSKGYYITTEETEEEEWDSFYEIVTVRPRWAEHHK